MPGCAKRYTDPSSLRKHVKNHALKESGQGRRKSHKDSSAKLNAVTKKARRRFSESSVYSATSCEPATPSTPLTPSFNNNQTHFTFDDDVFDEPLSLPITQQQTTTSFCHTNNNALNFDDMSNCLINLMDHSSLNNDSTVSIGGKDSDVNNYDINYSHTINCNVQSPSGIIYLT